MARLIDRTFNPSEPVVVRRHFVAAGRHFKIGDDFDWKRMSVDQRRVRQLYEAGKLMHRDMGTAQRPAPEEKDRPAAPTSASESPAQIEATQGTASDAAIDAALAAPADDEPQDDLTDLSMKELRAIAYKEGASSRVSRKDQRAAIREHRNGRQNQ